VALQIQTFKTRTITALVFVLVIFAGLFTSQFSFITLFGIIMLGCLYEFIKLIKLIHPQRYLMFLPISIVYIVLPLAMMIDLGIHSKNALSTGSFPPLFSCFIIFSIWINDTMAYIVGSSIGKTPLSTVSPQKTWEGTIGGFIFSIVSISLYSSFVLKDDWKIYFIIPTISVIAGTFGDLLESRIKREANVKDSGKAFPGHGGFLDRFDSLLLAVPSVWFFLFIYNLLSQIF
jgi:phosphatidate cytidylyltransferase